MNAAGYDAMALGNHEFDYGQDVLAERIREAKFPMLSANVIVEATGKPLTKDSVIYKRGCEDRNYRSHYTGNRGDYESEKCIWFEIPGR